MPGGYNAALRLFLRLRTDGIEPRKQRVAGQGLGDKQIGECIGTYVDRTLRYRRRLVIRDEQVLFDYQSGCRYIRKTWKKRVCSKKCCCHDMNHKTLDLQQCQAYADIRVNVLRAVHGRLPSELTEVVLEHAFATHGIPEDPRVFVPVESEPGGRARVQPKNEYLCPKLAFALYPRGEFLTPNYYTPSLPSQGGWRGS
jgi:hypothetical protein